MLTCRKPYAHPTPFSEKSGNFDPGGNENENTQTTGTRDAKRRGREDAGIFLASSPLRGLESLFSEMRRLEILAQSPDEIANLFLDSLLLKKIGD